MTTVSPLLRRWDENFQQHAQRCCWISDAGAWTYAEVDARTRAAAHAFQDAGIGPGDQVALWLDSCPEYFIVFVALLRLGAVPAVLTPDLRETKRDEILSLLDLSCILAPDEACKALEAIGARILPLSLVISHKTGMWESAKVDENALGAILFTSGSTGVSKGVMLSHKALGGSALATAKALGLTPGDRWIFNIPFAFTSAICHVLTCLAAGCSVRMMDAFLFPPQLAAVLRSEKATGMGGSPVHLRWLVEAVRDHGESVSIDKLMTSGDALLEPLWLEVRKHLPSTKLYHVYGMTELAGRFCILDPAEADRRIGSAGKAIEGMEAIILDEETGEPCAPGQSGEVYARGDYLMQGYYKRPVLTEATLTPRGLRTGDVGYMDAEGFLFLIGRSDDVFKSAGEKVSGRWIEQTIIALGLFEDVAVLANEDPFLGRVPKAYYVSHDGSSFNRKELTSALRKVLPASHVPRLFQEVKIIPRTGSGKVDRKKLREADFIGSTRHPAL